MFSYSTGCGEVRPDDEEFNSTRSQLRGIRLEKSLRMNNNHRFKFTCCPFRQRA